MRTPLLACLSLLGVAGCAGGPAFATLPQQGRRASTHPEWTIDGTLGAGSFSHKNFSPTTLDGDASATMLRFRLERLHGSIGGGFQIEGIAVDDDLHDNAGVGPVDTGTFEFFPHFTVLPRTGPQFRMPIRIGPSFQGLALDFDDPALGELTYGSFVVQVEIAPEVDLVRNDDFEMSLFTTLRGGVGGTVVSVQNTLIDEDFETDVLTTGVELGLRFGFGTFDAQVGYAHRLYAFDESDPEAGLVVRAADFEFEGILFTFGSRW